MYPEAFHAGIMGGGKKYYCLDYVQDGLVDIVDFYENAGYRTFDANLKNWYSLKSTDILIYSWARASAPYFREDGFYWSKAYALCAMANYSKVNFDTNFTIEFCGSGKNSFCGVSSYSRDTVVRVGLLGAALGWVTTLPETFGRIGNAPLLETHCIRATCNNGTVKFGNDGYGIYDTELNFSGKTFSTGSVNAYPSSTTTEGACNFKCFRVYNRVLSSSEISANYAIDKARFGIP